MTPLDPSLMEAAEQHFCDAFVTFGGPGDDLVRLAQDIAMAGKMAGLSKQGRRKLLEHLYAFIDTVAQRGFDPFSQGQRVDDPPSLFASDKLGGLFNIAANGTLPTQADLFDASEGQTPHERALIEQLIARLYDSSDAIHELFAFTIRLREFAPFNAMLLHIQKPGLTHAATAQDWSQRFGRVPKRGARPLLILRIKGPVDFVFDILDTEGRDVPVDAFVFPTFGNLTDNRLAEFLRALKKERIDLVALDAGDGQAGWIRLLAMSNAKTRKNLYRLAINRNHPPSTRFVTVAHELAHLFLGHLGADNGRRVPDRSEIPHALKEVEAEMAAYLVAMRNGLQPKSESYLAHYKGAFGDLNLYAVTRAANAIETAMGISAQKLWNEKA